MAYFTENPLLWDSAAPLQPSGVGGIFDDLFASVGAVATGAVDSVGAVATGAVDSVSGGLHRPKAGSSDIYVPESELSGFPGGGAGYPLYVTPQPTGAMTTGQSLAAPDLTEAQYNYLVKMKEAGRSLSGIGQNLLNYYKAYYVRGRTTYAPPAEREPSFLESIFGTKKSAATAPNPATTAGGSPEGNKMRSAASALEAAGRKSEADQLRRAASAADAAFERGGEPVSSIGERDMTGTFLVLGAATLALIYLGASKKKKGAQRFSNPGRSVVKGAKRVLSWPKKILKKVF